MKLFLSEGEKKAQELMDQIDKHPLTAKIREAEAAEILQKRKAAADKIEELKKEQADIIPKLQADLAGKEGKYQKAKDELAAASDELQMVKAALSREGHQFNNAIGQHEAVLYETADPLIDETIQFFRDKLDFLRSPGKIHRIGRPSKLNIVKMMHKTTQETNINAIKTALLYYQNAINGLEVLKLSPTLDGAQIEKLKNEIPSIDIYEEVTGEKPSPGSKGINPRHLLPSDSQLEWEMGKINEKFKKVMRK